jgi:hypothetical protein
LPAHETLARLGHRAGGWSKRALMSAHVIPPKVPLFGLFGSGDAAEFSYLTGVTKPPCRSKIKSIYLKNS